MSTPLARNTAQHHWMDRLLEPDEKTPVVSKWRSVATGRNHHKKRGVNRAGTASKGSCRVGGGVALACGGGRDGLRCASSLAAPGAGVVDRGVEGGSFGGGRAAAARALLGQARKCPCSPRVARTTQGGALCCRRGHALYGRWCVRRGVLVGRAPRRPPERCRQSFCSGYGDVGRGAGLVVMVGHDLFPAIVDTVDNRWALLCFPIFQRVSVKHGNSARNRAKYSEKIGTDCGAAQSRLLACLVWNGA